MMRHYTSERVQAAQWGRRFTPADKAAGYLYTRVGANHYYVPYGLVSVFPNEAQLQSLDQLIGEIRLDEHDAVCLSGSCTFIGQAECITDIDFCEYFSCATPLTASVDKKRSLANSTRLVCAKAFQKPTTSPSSVDIVAIVPSAGSEQPTAELAMKLDFVSQIAQFGPIVVTNLVLPLTETDDDAAMLRLSFPFQEAVIFLAPDATPKRSLTLPDEIGKYLNWLREQVRHYASLSSDSGEIDGAATIKALKRALSWFLMAGLTARIAEILEVLNLPDMQEITQFERAAEVSKLLATVDDGKADSIRAALEIGAYELAGKPERDQFFTAAAELAATLLHEIESRMDGLVMTEAAA